MNTCPNCGKIAGLHSSVLQGCMCQYLMQAPQREWVGLTDAELESIYDACDNWGKFEYERRLEAKLKEKNT